MPIKSSKCAYRVASHKHTRYVLYHLQGSTETDLMVAGYESVSQDIPSKLILQIGFIVASIDLQYEDETLQALAMSVLPDDVLEAVGAEGEAEDQLARRLLAFFKNNFFSWVCLQKTITQSLFLDLEGVFSEPC